MPDNLATVPIGGDPHQVTVTAGSVAGVTAGSVVAAIPDTASPDQVRRAAVLIGDAARRDPARFNVGAATRVDAPLSGEPHQVSTATATSATAAAGLLRLVLPANTTADQVRGAMQALGDRARRDPNTVRG